MRSEQYQINSVIWKTEREFWVKINNHASYLRKYVKGKQWN